MQCNTIGGYSSGGATSSAHHDTSTPQGQSLVQVGGATSSSHSGGVGGVTSSSHRDGHVLWGALSNSSSSSSQSKSRVSRDSQERKEYQDEALVGALLVPDDPSSSTDSHGSSIPGDRTEKVVTDPRVTIRVPQLGDISKRVLSRDELLAMQKIPRPELTSYLPLDDDGKVTSIGSINHALAGCTPCVLTLYKKGCRQSIFCTYCHFSHPEAVKKKTRPSKTQRNRYRKCLQRVESSMDEHNDPEHEVIAAALAASHQEELLELSKKETVPQKLSL